MTTLGFVSVSVLSVGSAVLLHAASRWLVAHRRGRTLCPGPRGPWWFRLVWLPGWIRRTLCSYDLRAAVVDELGSIRCPECGTSHVHGSRRLLGLTKRWRLTRIGIPVFALGAAGVIVQSRANEGFLQALPSPIILSVVSTLDEDAPTDMINELRRRTSRNEIAPADAVALVPQLIRELRDDDLHWNASNASDLLEQIGTPAFPLLEHALESDDRQQRFRAASILRSASQGAPSDAVLRVTVEQLRDNADLGFWGTGDASDALCYLVNHGPRLDYLLAKGLQSSDMQQRFLCATLAGLTMRTRLVDEAAPMLIDHLFDNSTTGDAQCALVPLYWFGEPALPYLVAARADADDQAAQAIDYLFYRLATEEERLEMRHIEPPRVTNKRRDPLSLQVWDLDVPQFSLSD